MTRQNVTDGPREILTIACPICEGDGIVVSPETHAVEAERRLRQHIARLEGRGVPRRDALRRRGDPDRPRRLAARGARAGDRPPLRVQDQEVLPARPLPDRLRGQGVGDRGLEPEGRGEAEGPAEARGQGARRADRARRRVRRRRRSRGARRPAPCEAESPSEPRQGARGATRADAEAETDAEEAPAADGDAPAEPKPKKKTRRGTRGGRGRKRKTTARRPPPTQTAPPSPLPRRTAGLWRSPSLRTAARACRGAGDGGRRAERERRRRRRRRREAQEEDPQGHARGTPPQEEACDARRRGGERPRATRPSRLRLPRRLARLSSEAGAARSFPVLEPL